MTKSVSCFVTGGTGFVGRSLLEFLAAEPDIRTQALLRRSGVELPDGIYPVEVTENDPFSAALPLKGVDVLIHCAARAHIMKDSAESALEEYRKVNVEGTAKLARQAAEAGVKRMIYISSVKVNGEETSPGNCFSADDDPAPQDPYGVSKYEAEQFLLQFAANTGLEIVIIRPPLVYGPKVKGNFRTLIKLVEKGIPLPLSGVRNERSLVSVYNLVDLIITCVHHPLAANEVFMVTDGEDLSTPSLLRKIGAAWGKRPRLFSVPPRLIEFGAVILGKKSMADRLLGSLRVDIGKTRELLGWEPPVSVDEGLRRSFLHD